MSLESENYQTLFHAISAVDAKVDKVADSVKGVVDAFEALSGAFRVLEAIGKIAKPVIWIAGVFSGIALAYHWFLDHVKIWVGSVR
jgi:hypothetical protein